LVLGVTGGFEVSSTISDVFFLASMFAPRWALILINMVKRPKPMYVCISVGVYVHAYIYICVCVNVYVYVCIYV